MIRCLHCFGGTRIFKICCARYRGYFDTKSFCFIKLFKIHASANVGFLAMEELDQARLAVMRCVQREVFSQIYALSSGRDVSNLTKDLKSKDLQQNTDLKITQTLNLFVEDGARWGPFAKLFHR